MIQGLQWTQGPNLDMISDTLDVKPIMISLPQWLHDYRWPGLVTIRVNHEKKNQLLYCLSLTVGASLAFSSHSHLATLLEDLIRSYPAGISTECDFVASSLI